MTVHYHGTRNTIHDQQHEYGERLFQADARPMLDAERNRDAELRQAVLESTTHVEQRHHEDHGHEPDEPQQLHAVLVVTDSTEQGWVFDGEVPVQTKRCQR